MSKGDMMKSLEWYKKNYEYYKAACAAQASKIRDLEQEVRNLRYYSEENNE